MPLNAALPPLEVVAQGVAREALQHGKADVVGTTRAQDVRFVESGDVQMRPTSVEPVHAKIGPKYRADARAVADALKALDPAKVGEQGVMVKLADGRSVQVEPGEYEIKRSPTLHGAAVDAIEVGGATLLLRKP
jgi:valyl-tRNA synthetase